MTPLSDRPGTPTFPRVVDGLDVLSASTATTRRTGSSES